MKARIDRRRTLIPLAIALVAAGGYAIDRLDPAGPPAAAAAAASPLAADTAAQRAHASFQQAVVLLRARRYDAAAVALAEVLAVYPRLPEAHANMGYAMLGLGRYEAAAGYFESATDLRPTLLTGYYGLALAEDGRGRPAAALAAMQVYAHLAAADDPFLARAEIAMRRWESVLPERTR